MRFKDKIAVVTGCASGLGQAVAVRMAEEAVAGLVLIDNDQARMAATVAAVENCAAPVLLPLCLDVSDGTAMRDAAVRARARFGGVDILINAAGVLGPAVPIVDCEEDDWDHLFAVNVRGTYLAARHFVPLIRLRGRGNVVNFASTAGLVGSGHVSPYSASKGAIVTMTKSMAINHATENIRVNCVCPGSIETPMLRETFAKAGDEAAQRERETIYRERHPMLRFGMADEVASVVLFLASDDASFVTGVAMPVDGGRLA